VALDGRGNIYAADRGNDRIQELSGDGFPINQWGTPGTGAGHLGAPSSVAIDQTNGDIYIADPRNRRIVVITSAGKIAHIFPYLATSLVLDRHGILYATDLLHHVIREISPAGAIVRTLPSGQITPGRFEFPVSIAVGGRGNLFIPDRGNNRIVKLSPDGKVVLQFGSYGTLAGQFDAPTGVAVDTQGNIYVADAHNDRIQEFTPTGHFITKWGGSGSGLGQFHDPSSVAVDPNGNIFVTDYSNNRVQKISPVGQPWATQGAHPLTP
jgi:DNA-binding beta-propeller fold protein YncE